MWGVRGGTTPPPTSRGCGAAGTQVRLHETPYTSSGGFRAQVAPRCGPARNPLHKENQWF